MNARSFFAVTCALLSVVSLRAQDDAAATPTPEPKIVQASAGDELKAAVGQTVTVEGKVTGVGATTGGGINFINMGAGPNAFVAVVFKSNAAAFTDGFDKYKDQTLRVTGKLELFKETKLEIVVKAPDQIKVMPPPKEAEAPKEPTE